MKKIMIALAAVALAMGVNAAAVDWQVSYAGKGTAWKDSSVLVLAFNGASYADVINLVTVSGSDNLSSALSAYALNGAGTQFTSSVKGTAKTATIQTLTDTSSMFWMILADGSYDAGSSVLWTGVTDITDSLYTPPSTGTTLPLSAASFANEGTIAGQAIPEPTSALMLLLGVAGLALRRKQA